MKYTKPPIASTIPHNSMNHGGKIIDNYFWLRDKNWPKVDTPEILEYVTAENNYYKQHENKALEKEIYEELKGRVKEDDESYPVKEDNFYYFTRTTKGQDYPVLYRKHEEKEELLLDCNALARDKSSFAIGDTEVSRDHSKLVYAYDSDGSERYNIYVKDLGSKKDLDDFITNTIGPIVWNKESNGFYYLALDDNWRRNRVFFHKLGTKQHEDILVYHELDPVFSVSIEHSSSYDYIFINSSSSISSEVHYLKDGELKLAIGRRANHLYSVDHMKDKFYITTNDKGKNFRLVVAEDFNSDNFEEIIPHSLDYYLVDVSLYNEYIVATKSVLGLSSIEYYNIGDQKLVDKIEFDEEVYEAVVRYTNKDDQFLRIIYSSLTTPKSVLEYDFLSKTLHTRKVTEIPSGYDSSEYQTKRLWASSKDGTKIPLSMVYRKDKVKSGEENPLLLYGYGSYGLAMPVSFRPNIISLLDRGFIYVIAHIRGGDELGYEWYESAKFLSKKFTFEDFISSAEYLIEQKYTSSDKLSIMGGSAGGMLMGVVVNERPELFKSVVALVPFVDVLNTMLDDSLPLTPGEFEEWGNPIVSKEYFDYIKSYCPYSNVRRQEYPDMLVTAGLTDPRVGYWEAAKWVAKLRASKTDNSLLLLKTEMGAGHKGQSGRFNALEEVAMIYSFLLGGVKN
ncbi:MAG: S9 family peptidase [Rickettsiales bacterium]|nr:S9 family peptidase [Rickettsiales bacterium]